MFGLVSTKRLLKEMADIYIENEKNIFGDVKGQYYAFGNCNALNALAGKIGVDLTKEIKRRKLDGEQDG